MKAILRLMPILLFNACAFGAESPCATAPVASAAVSGTDRVVKLINCSTADNRTESMLALYANASSDTPICFGRVELMDTSGNYFLGKIKSLEARTLADRSIVAVPSLAGGEANHFWTSQAFLRLDEKCGVTTLAKLYSRMHYDEDDGSKCEGAKHTYRFIDAATVELHRDHIHCTPTDEVVTAETKTFDLNKLLEDSSVRVMEP